MYNSNNVAERIKIIANSRNISIKKLLEDAGLGFNTMSNLKTSMPKSDNLAKIADCLNCSVDYLLGRTENPIFQKDTFDNDMFPQNGQAATLLAIFNDLDPINQAKLLVLADELKNSTAKTNK